MAIWLYALASVTLVSIVSLVGIFTVSFTEKRIRNIMLYFVSFAAGGMFGSAFLHLLPEVGYSLTIASYLLFGIVASFVVEKFVQWRHCHIPTSKAHPHPFAFMNLVGDGLHNFIDGIIIGASYLANIQLGIATTLAVVFHEIPQEIGDFGVLVHGGFSRRKALCYNFLFALTAIFGALVSLTFGVGFIDILVPFAAGCFIYIAGSDLIPELQKETKIKVSVLQFATFIAGLFVMFLLT